ncbi:MAG TPA: metal ABC transporter permease [Firmicutes bacterium]|nr:metal ABC transporter permease [Bacillota bacterium]
MILVSELLAFGFVQKGLIGAALIGSICSLIGVFVVLRGMSYIGSGIAHGCLAGVAFAFMMNWSPLVMSIIAALVMVVLIELISRKSSLKMDTSIGVIFSIALALAVLFIGMLRKYTPDIMSYLFGNLLRVTVMDLWVMGGIGILVAILLLLFFKELQFSTFDPEMAELSGIPAALISIMLSVLMALTIVVSLQAVGELLVLALIVLPASTAYQLTHSLKRMMLISVGLGVFASILGLILAFYLDAPTGSTIVMILGITFFTALGLRRIRVQSKPAVNSLNKN